METGKLSFAVSAPFALIYLAPMCMVFGSSFLNGKQAVYLNLLDWIIISMLSERRTNAYSTEEYGNLGCASVCCACDARNCDRVYAFKKKKGWKVLRTIYMIPNVVSAAALAVIFLNVFNAQYGIINSFVKTVTGKPFMKNWFFDQNSAFITVTWSWLLYTGMIIILVLAGVLSIPEDVVEAAKIDGATDMQINMKIRLPLIRTIIGTCEILAATSMLREFELIYLTTNGGPGDTTLNLPLYLYKTSMTDNNYGYANMMGVILIIAGVIVVSAINRLFKMNEADY